MNLIKPLSDSASPLCQLKPFFSIITVVLNAEKILAMTLDSIFSQNYIHKECIVIDGGSTDGTIELLKRYSQYLKYQSEKDKGIYDAMNKGIRLASGDYLNFMNAGDRFADCEVLSRISTEILRNKAYLVCADTIIEYTNGYKRRHKARLSLYDMPTYHQSMFFHKEVFRQCGFYNNAYNFAADFDLWQKVYRQRQNYVRVVSTPVSINNLKGLTNKNYFKVSLQKLGISYKNLSGAEFLCAIIKTCFDWIRFLLIYLLKYSGLYFFVIRLRYSPSKEGVSKVNKVKHA